MCVLCPSNCPDLISLEDAMEELELGPNGGLVYCMEYLLDNMDWLKDELDKFDEDEYIIFDCPGQVKISHDYDLTVPPTPHLTDEFFRARFFQQGSFL